MKEQKSNNKISSVKHNKGITLIALIISIIVLLILAVVSIGAIKNSKIIEHSQDTSSEYITAQEKEQLQLALSEWQIQKNIPNNSENFKNVMEEALKNSNVTISGSNAGPLTVTFNKTGNKYKVIKDGEISEIAKLEGTALEKYIFGENLTGRDLAEIVLDLDEMEFTNTNVQALAYGSEEYIGDEETLYEYYIKNSDIIYKFKTIYNDENEIEMTQPSYGLTKIVIDTENTRVGKTVSYDKQTWTIMYDDDTNGLQMICNETYPYNNENFYLGYNDSSITDWDSLNTDEDEEFRTEDLNKNGKLDDNLEKAIYSYNNAITTLNTVCEKLFKDKYGNYKNSNIIDVRCVGSNPTKTNKNAENATLYTSENLAKWPENNLTYSAGIGNGIGKSTDYNYVTDFDRMVALGINKSDTYYWLASRLVGEYSSYVYFSMRYVRCDGSYDNNNLWSVYDSDANGRDGNCALRPVVSLRSNVQLQATESGSETDYILN